MPQAELRSQFRRNCEAVQSENVPNFTPLGCVFFCAKHVKLALRREIGSDFACVEMSHSLREESWYFILLLWCSLVSVKVCAAAV
jgi:hypothetical protein